MTKSRSAKPMLLLTAALAAPIALAQSSPGPAPIAPTLSLGEPTRTAKLESDVPEMKYQNGFFFTSGSRGRLHIFANDGQLKADITLKPKEENAVPWDMDDVALFKDGSIVASWFYMLPGGQRDFISLVHYDPAGTFIEQIDLGQWRAVKICIADDKTIWAVSGKNEGLGHVIYSPDEGILRSYKFGDGLQKAVVPWSNFGNNGFFGPGEMAIDCSGDKIHAITNQKWIEYTPGADFTISMIEPLSTSSFGDFSQHSGLTYLATGHAYQLIKRSWGDISGGMLAELLPSSTDNKTVQWVEVPADKAIPTNTQPPASAATPDTAAATPDKPKKPIVLTHLYGADHDDGEQLVYRTSASDNVLWSHPTFSSLNSTLAANPLTFEVATIKPAQNPRGWNLYPTPDGYHGIGVSLRQLIREAYGVFDEKLLVGGPSWIDSSKFDLDAKFNAADIPNAKSLTYRQRADMLQPLLTERFHLKLHRETKEFPIYNLVVAKGGPKLHPTKPEGIHNLGIPGQTCLFTRSRLGFMANESCPADSILDMLRANTGRTVFDRTGLTSLYNIELNWTPENVSPEAAQNYTGPSIFTAVEEQLGLKLEPSTAPLDILVIDSAQPPSAN